MLSILFWRLAVHEFVGSWSDESYGEGMGPKQVPAAEIHGDEMVTNVPENYI